MMERLTFTFEEDKCLILGLAFGAWLSHLRLRRSNTGACDVLAVASSRNLHGAVDSERLSQLDQLLGFGGRITHGLEVIETVFLGCRLDLSGPAKRLCVFGLEEFVELIVNDLLSPLWLAIGLYEDFAAGEVLDVQVRGGVDVFVEFGDFGSFAAFDGGVVGGASFRA